MAASFRDTVRGLPRVVLAAATALVVVLAAVAGRVVLARAGDRASRASVTSAQAAPTVRAVHIPRMVTLPVVDGHLDEALWRDLAARSGPFVDPSGMDARPYSEARFGWSEEGGGALYVALFAADIDVQAHGTAEDAVAPQDDAFRIAFPQGATTHLLEGSVLGTLGDAEISRGRVDPSWSSGARLAADTDGTPNDSTDDDEEWTLEWRIPLAPLGHGALAGEHIAMTVRRCDSPRRGPRVCASFGDAVPVDLVLDP